MIIPKTFLKFSFNHSYFYKSKLFDTSDLRVISQCSQSSKARAIAQAALNSKREVRAGIKDFAYYSLGTFMACAKTLEARFSDDEKLQFYAMLGTLGILLTLAVANKVNNNSASFYNNKQSAIRTHNEFIQKQVIQN